MRRLWLTVRRAGLAIVIAASLAMAAGGIPAHATAALPAPGFGSGTSYCSVHPGDVATTYTFAGVYACEGPPTSTGATTFDAPCDPQGNCGYTWQCVEFSARFLWVAYGIWAGPGHVKNGATLAGQIGTEYHIPVVKPGPGSVPVPGDVISLDPGGIFGSDGHTGVVVDADPAAGKFDIISENNAGGKAGPLALQVDLGGGHDGKVSYGGPWITAS